MKLKNKVKFLSLLLAILFTIQTLPANAIFIPDDDTVSEGMTSIFPFSTIDMGRAGELNVNQQNQEIIIERNDITLQSCSFPVDITFYYSSFSESANRWHFNYSVYLRKSDDTIVMTRSDGSIATYEPTGELIDGKEKWIVPTEFGVIDYLLVPIGEYSFSDVILVSKLDGILYFSDDGKLSIIEHGDGSNTFIYYNSNEQIYKIIDGIGQQYNISYNKNNCVEEISVYTSNDEIIAFEGENDDIVPCTVKYNYNRNNLISIVYPDGHKVEYTYEKDKLISIKNVDERIFQINYNGTKAKCIKQLSEEKQKVLLEIEPTHNGVLISDEYDTNVKKTFNNITPKIIEEAGDNYIQNLRKFNSISTLNNIKTKIESKNNAFSGYDSQNSTDNYDKNIGVMIEQYNTSNDETKEVYDFANNLVEMSANVSHILTEIKNEYTYEADVLQSINHNGQEYNFLYDEWGNNTGVEIQGQPYIKYTYKDGKAELCQQKIYGNGQIANYYYNSENNLTGVSLDGGNSMIYEYFYDGTNVQVVDNLAGIIQNYYSDSLVVTDINTGEEIVSFTLENEDTLVMHIDDEDVELSIDSCTLDNDSDYMITLDMKVENLYSEISVVKDYFDRIENIGIEYSTGDKIRTFTDYIQYNGNETVFPNEFTTEYSRGEVNYTNKWSYDYYDTGKISSIYLNKQLQTHYEYDSIGQLIRADDHIMGVTTTYEYDSGGNVISKKYCNLNEKNGSKKEIILSYDNKLWNDQLTSYDGELIIYDEIGNPISYKNNTYKWTNGRQLEEYENELYKITYSYNDMGYRQVKTVYDKETENIMYQYNYYWGDGFVIAYTLTDYTALIPTVDTVVYQYDDNMNIYSYIVNGKDAYIYEKNAVGDIIGIYNNGKCVGKYHYDELGRIYTIFSNECASKYNQLYYRSYMYDVETELYYLQSRYYSPEWGRFLNADIYVDTGSGLLGTNMYIYCDNDPINKIDPTGYWSISLHKQMTLEVLGSEALGYNLDADKIADGNAYTDTKYSAAIYFAMPTRQGRHFDRHIRIDEADGDDTRGYYAAEHMNTAVEAYLENDFDTLNEELGFALHCLQDASAHGKIDVNTWALASHVGIDGVDSANYEWTDNDDRGETDKKNCVEEGNKAYGNRYEEALQTTALGYALFIILLEQSI